MGDGDPHPDRRRRPSGSRRPARGRRTKGRSWRCSARPASSARVLPIARPPDRPWLLFDDAGPTLRATRRTARRPRPRRLGADPRRVRRTASAPSRATTVVAAMLAAGVPDERPDRLADGAGAARSRTTDAGAGSPRRGPRLRRSPATAGGSRAARGDRPGRSRRPAGVAASIQHDDLHGGNIVVGPAGDRFFDWGDAWSATRSPRSPTRSIRSPDAPGGNRATPSSSDCATPTPRRGRMSRRGPSWRGHRGDAGPRLHRHGPGVGACAHGPRSGRDGRPRRPDAGLADGLRRAARRP